MCKESFAVAAVELTEFLPRGAPVLRFLGQPAKFGGKHPLGAGHASDGFERLGCVLRRLAPCSESSRGHGLEACRIVLEFGMFGV
eukprot:814119-Amphidinium_carterae.3